MRMIQWVKNVDFTRDPVCVNGLRKTQEGGAIVDIIEVTLSYATCPVVKKEWKAIGCHRQIVDNESRLLAQLEGEGPFKPISDRSTTTP
jgi:hypothetical protein